METVPAKTFFLIVCHGLPLFEWEKLRGKEEAISCRSFGLVFVGRKNGEKVKIKKILSKDDQEKSAFIKESKILHCIKSKDTCIIKFKAVYISNDKNFVFLGRGGTLSINLL